MSIIYVVKVEIDPVDEYTWDEWNTRLHIPDILAQPGFIRATKYKIDTREGEWSQYLILYEVDSRESLEAYLNFDYDAIENDINIPIFGNKFLLKIYKKNLI